jgi:hypothetical protein
MVYMTSIILTLYHQIFISTFFNTIAFRSFKLTKRGIIRLRGISDILHSKQISYQK